MGQGTQIWTSPTGHRYTDPPRTLTLPGELLVPSEAPPASQPAADRHRSAPGCDTDPIRPWSNEFDDEGLRPDWRDAEFGGPFPDTIDLKVLVTTVRNRVERVRDMITAPRPARTAQEHRDRRRSGDDEGFRRDVIDTPTANPTANPTASPPVDPDEPPF